MQGGCCKIQPVVVMHASEEPGLINSSMLDKCFPMSIPSTCGRGRMIEVSIGTCDVVIYVLACATSTDDFKKEPKILAGKASIAQLAERALCKRTVVGSIPTGG